MDYKSKNPLKQLYRGEIYTSNSVQLYKYEPRFVFLIGNIFIYIMILTTYYNS